MGLLFYNQNPRQQFFYNGSFELPLALQKTSLNWYPSVGSDVERQQDIVSFGSWALRLGIGSSIIQEGSHLLSSGNITVSILARGSGDLNVTLEILDPLETVLWSGIRLLKVSNPEDFNNVYAVFNVPILSSSLVRVTFTNSSAANMYLDNAKSESGKSPSRYSPSSHSKDPVVTVPEVFFLNPEVQDTNDPFLPPITQQRDTRPQVTSGAFQVPGTLRDGSSSGGNPVAGGEASNAYTEYKDFAKESREILKDERDEVVNKKKIKFYPQDKDEEFLKFTRDELKKKIDDTDKIGSMQRMGLLFAKNKMAAFRRAYESRVHSRLDYYSFGFMDKRLHEKYLRQEDGAIQGITGAG